MRNTRILLALVPLALGGAACEQVDSDEVATDAIHATMRITATGNGESNARTWLKVGGANSNTYLDLTERDALIAYADQDSASMARDNSLGVISYVANFATDAEETPFKISFFRTHEEGAECNGVSAPNSTVNLPAPFSITSPVPSTTYSRQSDAIPLAWDNAGRSDAMTWSATGDCIESSFDNPISGDPGTYTFDAGTFMTQSTAGCAVTITLERTRSGTLDPAYGEGGTIRAAQIRSVQINSQP